MFYTWSTLPLLPALMSRLEVAFVEPALREEYWHLLELCKDAITHAQYKRLK
jgi:hypothetical protein